MKKSKIVIPDYVAPSRTLFDGTNEEVLLGFGKIVEDIKSILSDEDFPSVFIAPDKVNQNASKKELGELYLREKVGERFYQLIKVFVIKKPDNIYRILDTLFCASEGTYKTRAFKDTLKDLKLLSTEDLKEILDFFHFASLSK